jgi:hypothetical protein
MTDDGTEFGRAVYSTITADGELKIVITSYDGKDETHEIGTTTAELEAHEDGMTTVAGTNTNELTGMTIKAVDGTESIMELGTDAGILVYETITADGDDAIVITSVDGKDETHEYGTTNTELDYHELGITTVAGT